MSFKAKVLNISDSFQGSKNMPRALLIEKNRKFYFYATPESITLFADYLKINDSFIKKHRDSSYLIKHINSDTFYRIPFDSIDAESIVSDLF